MILSPSNYLSNHWLSTKEMVTLNNKGYDKLILKGTRFNFAGRLFSGVAGYQYRTFVWLHCLSINGHLCYL